MVKRLILGLLVIVVIVLFTLNNTAPTELCLVGFTVHVPLALLLVISLALGAGIAILFLIVPAIRERRELKECRRELDLLKGKVEKLETAAPESHQNEAGSLPADSLGFDGSED
ncbi:MAG TPA: LapA family protein [Candidatus Aminicenantes bacterium]|nr:LapA family protein [Candidatus Aminicenantes bacterium]